MKINNNEVEDKINLKVKISRPINLEIKPFIHVPNIDVYP
tara:strand:- start:202 stop:321 length:120 start_codon:yes stop_codon:yes gene_type:complete